eukprot:RCo014250
MRSALAKYFGKVLMGAVVFVDLPEEERAKTAERVMDLGGSIAEKADAPGCTHFLSGVQSDLTRQAAARGLSVVSLHWLEDCETYCRPMVCTANVLYQPALPKFKCGEMQLLMVSQSGFQNPARKRIKDLICACGATYTISLSKYNSHLVVPSLDYTSDKIKGAKAWGVEIVHWYWLRDCFLRGDKVPEARYQDPAACKQFPEAEQYFSPPRDLKEFCRLYILANKSKIDLADRALGLPEDVVSFV